jgi:hypothetical protein
MSGESMNMPLPCCASRVKRLALLLLGAVLLLAALLPGPPPVSSAEAVVTVSVMVLPNPIVVTIPTPPRVRVGVPFPILAFIESSADSGIEEAAATIHPPDGFEVVMPGSAVDLGTIRAHGSAVAMWLVRALEMGNYVVLVSVSGIYGGDVVTGQDSALVTVRSR